MSTTWSMVDIASPRTITSTAASLPVPAAVCARVGRGVRVVGEAHRRNPAWRSAAVALAAGPPELRVRSVSPEQSEILLTRGVVRICLVNQRQTSHRSVKYHACDALSA